MTDKEKAIEAIEKAWEIINDKQPETTEEINLIRFAVNTARQLISKPTLDDAIVVVEEEIAKHDKLAEYYHETHKTVMRENVIQSYENECIKCDILKETLTALKGLKEGK